MTRINKIIDGNVAGILLCYVFRCWQLSFFGIPQNQFGRETQLDDTSVLVAQLRAKLSWIKLTISCCWSFAHKGLLKCVQYLPVAPPDPLFNPISLLALFSAPGRNWLQESLWFPWVWSLGHAFRKLKGKEEWAPCVISHLCSCQLLPAGHCSAHLAVSTHASPSGISQLPLLTHLWVKKPTHTFENSSFMALPQIILTWVCLLSPSGFLTGKHEAGITQNIYSHTVTSAFLFFPDDF